MLAGWELGANLVEIDVRRTRDGLGVILHDATAERLWERDLAVADTSLADLEALGIPSYERIVALAAAAGRGLMVDMPDPTAAELAADMVAKYDGLGDSLFAGEVDGLLTVRRKFPRARIALSWSWAIPPTDELMAELRPEFFNPWWPLVDDGLIESMRARGCGVCTWTVDAPSNIARLMDLGVGAIISNRPGIAVSIRKALA